jgi:choline dehydrogenase-like flavoprotein
MIRSFGADLGSGYHDLCVIGAGPVGISLSLELARMGRSVLMLESGGLHPSARIQALADAVILSPEHHAPMSISVQRSLGGTSNLWAGRCVPLDAADFAARSGEPGGGWPLTAKDVQPFLALACAYLQCGEPCFETELPPREVADGDFSFISLERWSRRPNFRKAYEPLLRRHPAVTVSLETTVTGMTLGEDGRVASVTARSPAGDTVKVAARAYALALGGLENARLLLAARMMHPQRFGGEEGPLGRYYMGHIVGSISQMVFADETLHAAFDYFDDGRGSYVRRRFTPSPALRSRENLTNIAFWPVLPALCDASHRSGVLSLGYLFLRVPPLGRLFVSEAIRVALTRQPIATEWRWAAHVANVLREFPQVAEFLPGFFYRRFVADPPVPGFFHRNDRRRYAVRYHAEHLPHRASRVSLDGTSDELGLPRLQVDLRFDDTDVAPVLRAHECFALWFARAGLGRVEWSFSPEEREAAVFQQIYDGRHQVGTTRMAASSSHGVVDSDCRVFGAANLFVAGSSVFPSSSQANPTLTAVALACRLAQTIAGQTSAAEAVPVAAAGLVATVP